jgi:hypothetical protein
MNDWTTWWAVTRCDVIIASYAVSIGLTMAGMALLIDLARGRRGKRKGSHR